MTKILVTGASGFIGRSLVKALRNSGHEVLGINSKNGDIASKGALQNSLFEGVQYVFHLAARSYIPDSWQEPAEFYRVNVQGTANVLELCRINGASLLYVSAYVYGQPYNLPISEEVVPHPNNPYSQSKYLAEQLVMFYEREFKIKTRIVRPFNIYGPWQKEEFLIPTIIKQVLKDDEIHIKDLTPRRDYLYIDDFSEAVLAVMSKGRSGEIYNVGAGLSYSNKEVIDIIQKLFNTSKPIRANTEERHNEIPDVIADISRIKDHTGWYPVFSLSEGLSSLIDELDVARKN